MVYFAVLCVVSLLLLGGGGNHLVQAKEESVAQKYDGKDIVLRDGQYVVVEARDQGVLIVGKGHQHHHHQVLESEADVRWAEQKVDARRLTPQAILEGDRDEDRVWEEMEEEEEEEGEEEQQQHHLTQDKELEEENYIEDVQGDANEGDADDEEEEEEEQSERESDESESDSDERLEESESEGDGDDESSSDEYEEEKREDF